MASLAGKIALVTGAARGIGLAVARKFVQEGAKVVLADIRPEGRERAAELGANAAFVLHDVRKAERWDEAVAETRSLFGPVSVLVNNAAIASFMPTHKCTEQHYREVIEANQLSVLFGIQAVIRTMREAGGGSIINTSSTAGIVGSPASIAYVAAKWAVTGMTKAAAIDLASFGIRVNSVHPGPVETPMLKEAEAAGLDLSAFNTALPLARLAQPRELAGVYAFLASDEASFCTGACFVVDGGVTAS